MIVKCKRILKALVILSLSVLILIIGNFSSIVVPSQCRSKKSPSLSLALVQDRLTSHDRLQRYVGLLCLGRFADTPQVLDPMFYVFLWLISIFYYSYITTTATTTTNATADAADAAIIYTTAIMSSTLQLQIVLRI